MVFSLITCYTTRTSVAALGALARPEDAERAARDRRPTDRSQSPSADGNSDQ